MVEKSNFTAVKDNLNPEDVMVRGVSYHLTFSGMHDKIMPFSWAIFKESDPEQPVIDSSRSTGERFPTYKMAMEFLETNDV
jgi:hypothetical protein